MVFMEKFWTLLNSNASFGEVFFFIFIFVLKFSYAYKLSSLKFITVMYNSTV